MATEYQPSPSKQRRLDVDQQNKTSLNGENDGCGNLSEGDKEAQSLELLRSLKLTRILNNRSFDKFIVILAEHPQDKSDALVMLEKTPFPSDVAPFNDVASHWVSSADFVMQNDIFHKLNIEANPKVGLGTLKATVIHPATERLIARHEEHTFHLLLETPQIYEKIVKPYIEKTQHSLNWVHNILCGTKEQDRVIYSDEDPDTGFILSVDLKWDGKNAEDMYCLALVRRTDLASLRDLKGEDHLPLLRNISKKCRQVLMDKLGVSGNQFRVFFHYPPSFYHLHVHFTFAGTPVAGAETERAHLLDTVIENLQLMPDYYQHASLTIGVRDNDPLYKQLMEEEKHTSTS